MNTPSSAHATGPAMAVRRAALALGWWAVVMLAAVVTLRVADSVPAAVHGTARGVRVFRSLDDLERAAGRRMPVPAYFPSTIEWPPGESRLFVGRAAAYWCRHRVSRAPWLIVATAPGGAGAIAPALLPEAAELQAEDAILAGRSARAARLRDADGAVWHQVSWSTSRERVLVRSRGTLDELMHIAASIRE
jgi:hypothetical protein